MNIYSLDIESNDLLSESINFSELPYKLKDSANLWVVSLLNIETGEKFTKDNKDITREWLQEILSKVDVLLLHNGHRFDLIMLQLFGLLEYSIGNLGEPDIVFGKKCRIIDTLILSRYLWPDRPGFHSLDSWGKRVGLEKIDFRQICIDKGYIEANAPKGAEFKQYCPEMVEYCENDCAVTGLVYQELITKLKNDKIDLTQGFQQEQILSDIGLGASTRGFYFGKDLALGYVEDLITKMQGLYNVVTPLLPPKKLNKGELAAYTPPKVQLKKDGTPSSHMANFAKKHNGFLNQKEDGWVFTYKDRKYILPFTEPLEIEGKADISDLDHVKQFLLLQNWSASEWRERDLTKDSKKQNLPYQKRIAALRKYVEDTLAGKYKKERLEIIGIPEDKLYSTLAQKLQEDRPVRVPVSPLVRLSGSKELDPNLIKLGEKVGFAKDFADYLTFRHRRSSISGGDIEDVDWDPEHPNTGFLSLYREEDHRIPTDCIEIGTNTFRMRHIGCANIARVTSQYGYEMRSLFRAAPGEGLFGYDFASLENRILGAAVYKYDGGKEMANRLIADKPFDQHTVTSQMLGITRDEAKSVNYGIAFGAQPAKLAKMLGCSLERAKEIYNGYWEMNYPLKEYKERLEKFWESTGKKYVVALDGRRIYIRSKHSIINAITQANGAIFGKYVAIFIKEELSKKYNMNPFTSSDLPVNLVITYHDEQVYNISDPTKIKFKVFNTEEEGVEFIKNWEGEHQIGGLCHDKKWYVALPNDFSIAVENGIRRTEKLLKLPIEMGFEYKFGSSWASIH